MDVHVIDARDDQAFAAWYAVVAAAQRELWPDEPGWLPGEFRALALAGNPSTRVELLAAVDPTGTVVGAARTDSSLLDNLHLVGSRLSVHPDHRRRGAGRALLAAVERRAVADGRTVSVVAQDESAQQGDQSPGRSFALAHGYEVAQRDLRRDLALPIDTTRVAALEADCAPRATGYRLVSWLDRCPDEFVDDRAYLGRRMSTDIPLGDLALEEEAWDAARVRRREAVSAASDRIVAVAGAVHEATGRMVAFTELQIPRGAPQHAYQGDTIVAPEHRGHRLGALVKIANLRQLAAVSPATTKVTTWNADDNKYMIAVNEALGCTVNGTNLEWQKRL
jgi:GNAT superfamily N-acetyltransferase/RimJ/RimL family protein N-acetyltransferase